MQEKDKIKAEEQTPQPHQISDDEYATVTVRNGPMYLPPEEETGTESENDDDEESHHHDPIDAPPSDFSIDDSISKELLKLTFHKRVTLQEEVHGVRCLAPDETDEMVQKSMEAFDRLLMDRKHSIQQRINSNSHDRRTNVLRNVTSMAQPVDPTPDAPLSGGNRSCYLNDPNVRLRFLRCEKFDVPLAVDRMVNFLQLGTELFGDYVAERPIRISDFGTRKEEVALQNSRNQFLPFRDRSGRRVYVGVGNCDFLIDFDLRFKIMLYMYWIASEDVETQQKGVVIVAWPTNESEEDDSRSWEITIRPGMNARLRYLQKKMSVSMPLRVVSLQAYYPDTPFFRALSTLYYLGMNSQERIIYKAHFGEDTELRYALMSYGIMEQLLPLSNTGTVKTANHSRWINALRAKAEREDRRHFKLSISANKSGWDGDEDSEEEMVDCPGSRDVIFRKGPTYKNNPGNMYFRELIEQTHDQHMKASRKEKCLITWNIVREIEARNGRFLNWSKSQEMWIVARDREKIRTKVAACYKRYNRQTATAEQKRPLPAPVPVPIDPQPTPQQQSQQHLPMPSSALPLPFATGSMNLADPSNGYTNPDNCLLREYYDSQASPSKRRKTFSLFCGVGYLSSSDSSYG